MTLSKGGVAKGFIRVAPLASWLLGRPMSPGLGYFVKTPNALDVFDKECMWPASSSLGISSLIKVQTTPTAWHVAKGGASPSSSIPAPMGPFLERRWSKWISMVTKSLRTQMARWARLSQGWPTQLRLERSGPIPYLVRPSWQLRPGQLFPKRSKQLT